MHYSDWSWSASNGKFISWDDEFIDDNHNWINYKIDYKYDNQNWWGPNGPYVIAKEEKQVDHKQWKSRDFSMFE